ncbi:MAG: hypothetical protein V2I37_01065 [Marinilabiliaceae bacterium]|jgi:hypothetical protein|nr:hypothetical protein [Marinilabiliaceae bacterium]
MQNTYLSLDEKPEKKAVSFLMVVFGILCLFFSGWWAVFLLKVPENENSYWVATIFLFLFGLYQVYAGLGYARRYISLHGKDLVIRQNSFLPPVKLSAPLINSIIIRSMDIIFENENGDKKKLKLGLRYPDLGEKIKEKVVEFANLHSIELYYKYDGLND